MKFAITGMGRSGTKFLTSVLNLDPAYTVQHEPHPGCQPTVEVIDRFRRAPKNYGEVNSYLRWQALALPVNYCAVILRDPLEIWQSMLNRGKLDVDHLDDSLRALDCMIALGVPTIAFSRMTTDADYLREIAAAVGITLPSEVPLARVNESRQHCAMSNAQRAECHRRTVWFRNLYGAQW